MEFHFTARDLATRYLAEAGRHFYTTPTMYLQLLDTYILLKGSKQDEVATKQERYEIGLEKLLSTAAQVNTATGHGHSTRQCQVECLTLLDT